MDSAQIVSAGIAVVALVISLLNFLATRGDKGGEKHASLAKQVGELALQISNLRTELAQQELSRHKELEDRFVGRREWEERDRAWKFTERLTLETHKRMHPEAAIHEPGAIHA